MNEIPLTEQHPVYLATIAEMARQDIEYYTRLEMPKYVKKAQDRYTEATTALIAVTLKGLKV